MKKQCLLAIILLISVVVQSQSAFTTIQYNKNMQPALRLELSNTVADVEGMILEKLKQAGYKPETEGHLFWKENKVDGFYVFNNISLSSLGTQKLDIYFKVVQKNREEKNSSTVYFLVSTGNENFVAPDKDTLLWNSAEFFLNGFIDNTTAYSLEQDIKKQETMITNSQIKLSTLVKNEKDMDSKIKKIQDDIRQNQIDQKNQQFDLDSQKKLLEDLKLKRRY